MTAHVPMARVPFAPLDNPRLQHLASAKNRQNGVIASKSLLDGKPSFAPTKAFISSPKRSFDVAALDDYDEENIDPTRFNTAPSKKTKGDAFTKPSPLFTMTSAASKMPPPPSRLSTPLRANISAPRAPLTAPAGRSPKRKSAGITKNRRVSAPFSRIDHPLFGGSFAPLPFSLDAAIQGSLSKPTSRSAGLTIQESMPQNWFFDIYEDTPEEEASTLMEHSTLTLDLSSDDESTKKERDDRGKENVAPEGYEAPVAPRTVTAAATREVDIVRRKLVTDEMDDGERSPLSDLDTDPFIPKGLDKHSHVIVNPTSEKSKLDITQLFAAPVPFTPGEEKSQVVVAAEGDVKGEIIVWEDSPKK